MKNKKKLLVSVMAGLLAALLLLTLIVGIIPVAAGAASSKELKGQLNDLKAQRGEIRSQIKELESHIKDNMSEMEKIVAEKNVIDQEIGLLSQEILNVNEQITAYGLLIADKQDELDTAQARLLELNQKNKARIRAMEEDGSLSYWAVLFKASSFADLLDRLNMIQGIAAADQRRLKEMSEAADEVAVARDSLEVEKADLEVTRAELDVLQEELDGKRAEADQLLHQLIEKGKEYEQMVDQAEADEEALIAQIAAAEKAYNEARAREEEERRRKEEEERKKREEEEKKKQEEANKNNQNNQNNGNSGNNSSDNNDKDQETEQQPGSSEGWIRPCKYKLLSSPYGWRTHPVYGDRRFHSGVDLAGSQGTPIVAARSGTVTTASYNGSSGYFVTINHGDGYSSSYLHMTGFTVKVGQKVSRGQTIGYMGSTGVSTGPHLHFSIYYNGSTVNPASYISF